MLLTNNIKVSISGDSHGPGIIATIEGVPFGEEVDEEYINNKLSMRRKAGGRGERMGGEEDCVKILSGVWKGKTTGMPISFFIENRVKSAEDGKPRTIPRPGHADYSAYLKWGEKDLRIYAEGSSARRTAGLTAAGAFLQSILEKRNIFTVGYVFSVGDIEIQKDLSILPISELKAQRDQNSIYMPDSVSSEKVYLYLEKCLEEGITPGSSVKTITEGLPAGVGSFSSFDTRLDALLGGNLMGIPSVKGVYIGDTLSHRKEGMKTNDQFIVNGQKISRLSNHCGGIEGGISNGERIEITCFLKPIPSMKKSVDSVDLETGEKNLSKYVRSDISQAAPAAVIAENLVSIVLFDFLSAEGKI